MVGERKSLKREQAAKTHEKYHNSIFYYKMFIRPVTWKVYPCSLKQWHVIFHAFILNRSCSPDREASILNLYVEEINSFKNTTYINCTGFRWNNWSSCKKFLVWVRWYSTSSSLCLMGWFHYPSSSKIWGVAFPQPCTLIWPGTLLEHHSSEASPKTWGLFLLPLLEKEEEGLIPTIFSLFVFEQ